MSRVQSRGVVAVLALAAFVLPAVPVSLLGGPGGGEMMACCAADHCRMPALSAPCCSHASTPDAAAAAPATTQAVRPTTVAAHWDAFALDLPTLADSWRARALADSIRGRPPDPPHLLNGVFLI